MKCYFSHFGKIKIAATYDWISVCLLFAVMLSRYFPLHEFELFFPNANHHFSYCPSLTIRQSNGQSVVIYVKNTHTHTRTHYACSKL